MIAVRGGRQAAVNKACHPSSQGQLAGVQPEFPCRGWDVGRNLDEFAADSSGARFAEVGASQGADVAG